MKDNPLVTIAIPVFNGEKHVSDAIKSVLSQTYTNWELFIIDDGSKDRTLEIVSQFNDARIKLISDGFNKGLSSRLNQSIDLANGSLYARMDADDIMIPQRIEKQVIYMINHPECDVVGSSAYIIDGNNRVTAIRMGNRFKEVGFISVLKFGGFMHPTVLGRTKWFKIHNYDVNAERYEDIELWLRTADQSHFGYIIEPLLFYREYGDQSSKVEKTLLGYRMMLKSMISTSNPEYRPLLINELRKSHIKIWLRRLAHAIGLEKKIVEARSKRLSEDQRENGTKTIAEAISIEQNKS